MAQTPQFFEHLRDHTEIKLRILSKFLVPWSAKLGYKAGLRGRRKLWYVDGFAGPGKYGDGSAGSPIIGAGQALEVREQRRGYVLGCVNVEMNARLFASLERETSAYEAKGVEIHNLHGDFSVLVPEISKIIDPVDPVLVFVDPFGIKPLVYDRLKGLLARRGEVDLILVFQSPAVHRLVRDYPHYVTRAVGGDEWLADWDTLGVDAVYDTLRRNLLSDGRFRAVERYGVREEKAASPHYYMVIGSRSYHAFELLNDMICQEEKQLDEKTYAKLAQPSFLPQLNGLAAQQELVNAILAYGRVRPRTTRRDIVEYVVSNRWATWHTGDIKTAVKGLIDAGRITWRKQGRGHIDTDPLQFEP
jgi:three-Cys-motif partner protein